MTRRVGLGMFLIIVGCLVLAYALYMGFSPFNLVAPTERVRGPDVIFPALAYPVAIFFWIVGVLDILGKLPDSQFND